MKRVILTEKPSVARDIAAVLCPKAKPGREWIEGAGTDGNYYYVTWCWGHLLELYVPEAAGKWDIDRLPILPCKIGLRPIPPTPDERKKLQDGEPSGNERRLQVIRSLFERSDEIIAATDAGREGQGIFENVYRYLKVKRPVWRLWIMSLTEDSIREGMERLQDNASDHYRLLGYAAWERSVADWMVGINATRMFSLTVGAPESNGHLKVLSQGRVQTLTLCMICDRYEEHRNFRSEPYWFLEGSSVKDGIAIKWRCEDRFDNKAEATAAYDAVRKDGFLNVVSVKTERKTEQPPLLHDLASLQKMANTVYSLPMEETLDALQSLYLKHLVSYPRTGCRYIPSDVFDKVPERLASLAGNPVYGKFASRLSRSKLNNRCVSDTETSDHHGLVITGQKLPTGDNALTEVEQQVFGLVAQRFIEAFMPPCIADVTTVDLESAGITFTAKGRKEVSAGWRAITKEDASEVVSPDEIDEIEISMNPLPTLAEGGMIRIDSLLLQEDKTKPRPLLTDATLLTSMENAGRKSDDREVQATLKDVGVGTPATRSEILQTLLKRGYVRRSGKKLVPEELGLTVYRAVNGTSLANVSLTARWEMALAAITEGRQNVSKFEEALRRYTIKVTEEMRCIENRNEIRKSFEALQTRCPKCGHIMRLGDKSAWCNNKTEPGCGFSVWRIQHGKPLSDATLRTLINTGHTSVLKGFPKKDGTTYDAGLILREDGNTDTVFPSRK